MARLTKPTATARAVALLALGALVVHELRYLLAYGGQAQAEMTRQGHGYLGELTPALAVLAMSLIAGRLLVAAAGRRSGRARTAGPLRYATALIAIFCVQELAEGVLFAGHAAGLAGIFASGGWLALPLALLIGWLCARLDQLLDVAERLLVRRARRIRPLPRPLALGAAPALPLLFAPSPLAFGLARRPPPLRGTS